MEPYRLITSPVAQLPGVIEFPERLTLPEVISYRQTGNDAMEKDGWEHLAVLLPVQIQLTGKWSIVGIDEHPALETFTFTPAAPYTELLRWLHGEFIKLILGEQAIPNASRPRPTPTQTTPANAPDQSS